MLAVTPDPRARYHRAIPEDVRRGLLLSAAEELFLARGFVATTMSDVARSAGMSKKTIYQVFESKTELFLALLRLRLTTPPAPPGIDTLLPETALTRLLQHIAQQVLAPETLALRRLILGSLPMLPEIRGVFEAHCLSVHTLLESWLQDGVDQGRFQIGNVPEAASLLLAYAIGDFHWRLLAGVGTPPTEPEIAARIEAAVALFLRDHAVAVPIPAAAD
ncbi:TetR/AcrR family transcriptional regulator [Acidisoma sp. 7E03]